MRIPAPRKAVKLGLLHAARAGGLFRLARRATRDRLRIVCFHGGTLGDEHRFWPWVFMSPATFERRLRCLAKYRVRVVGLEEGWTRLRAGRVAEAETVLTFDDGWRTTAEQLIPLAERRGWPVTLYVTSATVASASDAWSVAVAFLLWKSEREAVEFVGLGRTIDGAYLLGPRHDAPGLSPAREAVLERARRWLADEVAPAARDRQLRAFAAALGLEAGAVLDDGRFRFSTPAELRALADRGVAIELHTHEHVTPASFDEMTAEIRENARLLAEWTGRRPGHFCYPNGVVRAEHPAWLAALGVRTATTCLPGLNDAATPPMLLRRIIDADHHRDIEFEAEVSGFAELCRNAAARARAALRPGAPAPAGLARPAGDRSPSG